MVYNTERAANPHKKGEKPEPVNVCYFFLIFYCSDLVFVFSSQRLVKPLTLSKKTTEAR